MDSHNRFETKTTATLLRTEWLAGLVACSVLAIMHIRSIDWAVFAGFFVIIDAIGYIPGAIAYRRSPDHQIHQGYYVAYNTMHSLVTGGAMSGIWCLAVRPEWALMAIPIHLLGDRGLFGNTTKPFGVSFEPVTHPAFARFETAYRAPGAVPQPGQPMPSGIGANSPEGVAPDAVIR